MKKLIEQLINGLSANKDNLVIKKMVVIRDGLEVEHHPEKNKGSGFLKVSYGDEND